MYSLERISSFLFIIAAIISIASGAFSLFPSMNLIVISILIFIGVFIGMINIKSEQQGGFLLGSSALLISMFVLNPILTKYLVLSNIEVMIEYFMIFLATTTFVVSLGWVINLGSTIEVKKSKFNNKITFWDQIVISAVGIAILIFVLSLFFDVSNYQNWIQWLDIIVSIVFFIDLVVLYRKAEGFIDFIKKDYLDIIAAIPFSIIVPFTLSFAFNLTKVGRLVKVMKVLRIVRISRTIKPIKYFSKRSGFTKVFDKK